MLTRRGLAMIAGGVGLLVLARIASIDELYVLAAASAALPVAAIAFVRWGRHRIEFVRTVGSRRVFAGSAVRIDLIARNLGRLPSPPLFLEDPAPPALGGPIRLALPTLKPDRSESVAIERRVATRGRYAIGPLRARLVDPFGLAAVQTPVAGVTNLTVYPAIEMLHEAAPPETRGGLGRSLVQRLSAGGDEFYAVRDWADGDDLRKIHWRSSARRGELMIRQDEIRPYPRATVFLDTRVTQHRDGGPGSSFEWMISAAASIVWELGRQGFALRLATADRGPGGARWGREAADPLLSTLAVTGRATHRALSPALRRLATGAGGGGALIAIGPPPHAEPVLPLARVARGYTWAGAVLINGASFRGAGARDVALDDQRLAEVERALKRAGWKVVVAGASDRFADLWTELLGSEASRPRSPLSRS